MVYDLLVRYDYNIYIYMCMYIHQFSGLLRLAEVCIIFEGVERIKFSANESVTVKHMRSSPSTSVGSWGYYAVFMN